MGCAESNKNKMKSPLPIAVISLDHRTVKQFILTVSHGQSGGFGQDGESSSVIVCPVKFTEGVNVCLLGIKEKRDGNFTSLLQFCQCRGVVYLAEEGRKVRDDLEQIWRCHKVPILVFIEGQFDRKKTAL